MATFVPDLHLAGGAELVRPVLRYAGARRLIRRQRRSAGPRAAAGAAAGDAGAACDHIEYIAQHAGLAHVGIGSDFFGGHTPLGLENVSCFPLPSRRADPPRLVGRAIAGIASENFVRVFRKVEQVGRTLRKTQSAAGGPDRGLRRTSRLTSQVQRLEPAEVVGVAISRRRRQAQAGQPREEAGQSRRPAPAAPAARRCRNAGRRRKRHAGCPPRPGSKRSGIGEARGVPVGRAQQQPDAVAPAETRRRRFQRPPGHSG